jgi:hypothetical protein
VWIRLSSSTRASEIMLAPSCDSIELANRGSPMCRMTWQAISAGPHLGPGGTALSRERVNRDIELEKRGSIMWRMTWRVTSARCYRGRGYGTLSRIGSGSAGRAEASPAGGSLSTNLLEQRSVQAFRVNADTDARTRFMVECLFSKTSLSGRGRRVIENEQLESARART